MAKYFNQAHGQEQSQTGEINISPLIDIVFILLIFFIVTTVFVKETGVDITKPQAASQRQLEQDSILFAVTADGEIFYNGERQRRDRIQQLVKNLLLSKPGTPVIIQADALTPTEGTVHVLDQAKLAGAEQVFVATKPE